jgi:hypothetical protein
MRLRVQQLLPVASVAPEGADEEYWCPEQVVDSFLDLYGPEFII